jgi:hypothetical protein
MPPVDKPLAAVVPSDPQFASKDDWFNAAGKLKEATLEVEGIGLLLLSEISGTARAQIVSKQSAGLLADAKQIDALAYQKALLLAGVIDGSSPEGARVPLFSTADIDRVMTLGGQKIAKIVDKIEELSALGSHQGRAEENSPATPSVSGISG